ncbi:hypothetical protein ICN82_16240, partial [Mangrovicoccus sp. HB182678]|nr:hypothetical protein [Mangrovicoccus algicola]
MAQDDTDFGPEEAALELFLSEARRAPPLPAAALLARIEADAARNAPAARAAPRRSRT